MLTEVCRVIGIFLPAFFMYLYPQVLLHIWIKLLLSFFAVKFETWDSFLLGDMLEFFVKSWVSIIFAMADINYRPFTKFKKLIVVLDGIFSWQQCFYQHWSLLTRLVLNCKHIKPSMMVVRYVIAIGYLLSSTPIISWFFTNYGCCVYNQYM